MAITLKDVLSGKAQTLLPEQEYEVYPGKPLKMLYPSYALCDKFDKAGWKPRMKNGKPERNEEGGLIIDDERAFHEVVLERCCLIFGQDIDIETAVLPVLYRAHEDFLRFLRPIENGQTQS